MRISRGEVSVNDLVVGWTPSGGERAAPSVAANEEADMLRELGMAQPQYVTKAQPPPPPAPPHNLPFSEPPPKAVVDDTAFFRQNRNIANGVDFDAGVVVNGGEPSIILSPQAVERIQRAVMREVARQLRHDAKTIMQSLREARREVQEPASGG